jgi:hypothetical protein
MKNAPIKFSKNKNNIMITAFIKFYGNYAGKLHDCGRTYAEIAAASIEAKWSGTYMIYGEKTHVTTKVFSKAPRQDKQPQPETSGQGYLKIKISGGTLASKIMRSHEKMSLKGILKNDESISVWSVQKSSSPIIIYVTQNFQGSNPNKLISKSCFEGTVAHEFGHALGLGDAYNAGYRGGKYPWAFGGLFAPASYEVTDKAGKTFTVTVPNNDMMLNHGIVSDNDMRMVLKAYETGTQQFFPKSSGDWAKR